MGKPINDQHGSPNSTVAQNGEHSTQSNIKASPHFVFQNGEFCSPVKSSQMMILKFLKVEIGTLKIIIV